MGKALADLLKCGISVSKLKTALEKLRSTGQITPHSLPGKYLVTNGIDIFFTDRKDVFEDLNAGGQFVFAFVFGVHRLRRDVLSRYYASQKRVKRAS